MGNTTHRKGFDLFVETAEKTPSAMFLWCGGKENYYNEIMANRNLTNFIYLGKMNAEELSGVYQLADCMLMSSRKDTLPSIIFEALLFGTPVIGSKDSGGIIDIINERNGILTDSADANQFSKAIQYLMKDNKHIILSDSIKSMDLINLRFDNYVEWLLSLYRNK